MEQAVQDFIQCKRIAVVGVSRQATKFGNMGHKELKDRGYQVFPIHAELKEINGDPCYPNLAAVQGKVDGVWVCVAPQKSEAVLREAAQLGIRNVWVQQGAETPQTKALGQELGLNLVTNKCVLMYAEPVKSFHGIHRFFAKLFGQL